MRTPIAILLAAALPLAAACGSDVSAASPESSASPSQDASDEGFPVTVASGEPDSGDETTISTRPEAIVSLSPTATEMLFAIGAGDQVIAVDSESDYPAGVPTTDLSAYELNIEAVLGYAPDLVLAAGDPGDLVSALDAAGVPVLLLPAVTDIDGTYSQIERVGAATGHVADAAAVVAGMQTEIDGIVATLPDRAEPLTYYHELDETFYSVTGDTFIGAVYTTLGLTSIADAAGEELYPQLSQEFVIAANPDVIFLADAECCAVTADSVAARPGWAGLDAVSGGRVYPVSDDLASRWGPRVTEFMATVAAQVAELQPAG